MSSHPSVLEHRNRPTEASMNRQCVGSQWPAVAMPTMNRFPEPHLIFRVRTPRGAFKERMRISWLGRWLKRFLTGLRLWILNFYKSYWFRYIVIRIWVLLLGNIYFRIHKNSDIFEISKPMFTIRILNVYKPRIQIWGARVHRLTTLCCK